MRVLVLGATGFIGGHIARHAHQAGMEVHGLRRRPDAAGAIPDVPITWHAGDLADPASLAEALRGCEVLFHAAAIYPRTDHRIRPAMQRAARQMRTVLETAHQAGVSRVVYTSSLSTIGAPPPDAPHRLADERDAYLPGSVPSAYYEAKWVMEHEALRATLAGLPVVILIPSAVFGPGDVKPTTSEVVLRVAQGRMPVALDVVVNFVDGRDVAQAHVRATMLGEPGERYIIGGHNLNVADALRQIARLAGVRPPRIALSVRTATRLLSLARMLNLPVPDLLFGVEHFRPLNPERGWQTFGFTPRPFEETIRDTLTWFREHGYL